MDTEDLKAMWRMMAFEIDPLQPAYMPLDVEDRGRYLKAAKQLIPRLQSTLWEPEGEQHGNSQLRYTDCEPSTEFEQLAIEIEPFLDRFYA